MFKLKRNYNVNHLPVDEDLSKFAVPYTPEKFTTKEKKVLLSFFTNWDKPVFAIYNLPQEVVGAMFSRYSRSAKSVRRIFLDEFWNSEELDIKNRALNQNFSKALERTKNFYERVFAEYGDDSVIQMGGVHVAFEFVSQILGAKAIEDQRVASAYIEKSTRYVDFSTKINDHYLFMESYEISNSRHEKEFLAWNNFAFDCYVKYLPVMTQYLSEKYPLDKEQVEDSQTKELVPYTHLNNDDKTKIQTAYTRALKAKAYDTIRFFLPVTTVTNLGAFFSGQAAETAINKMLVSPYFEARVLGQLALRELLKVSPNFLQNIDHPFGVVARNYRKEVRERLLEAGNKWGKKIKKTGGNKEVVKIIDWDTDADIKVASEVLFTGSSNGSSKKDIVEWAKKIKRKEKQKWSPTLVKVIMSAIPDRKISGRNRRQKLPRAFEHVYVEVEFYTDIGAYKDLQRNRLSSTERQMLTTADLYIPKEYKDKKLKALLSDYLALANKTRKLHAKMLKSDRLKVAAEYVTIMGNRVRYTIRANLRQWVFFAELRTISGGHPSYRYALQEAARQIVKKMPFTSTLFAHVDWINDYGLGRLKAEIKTQNRLEQAKQIERLI